VNYESEANFSLLAIIFWHSMNADSSRPRLSPAEWLFERPKSHQKAADTKVSVFLLFIHGF
jgi:hypothetical protein